MKIFLVIISCCLPMSGLISAAYGGQPDNLADEFCHAAELGRLDVVKGLVDRGIDIEIRDSTGCTALMTASFWGQTEVVAFLLSRKAKVNERDSSDRTALMMISTRGAEAEHIRNLHRCAELLLSHGADPNMRYVVGDTPIMAAARNGDLTMILLLLKHGADLNAKGGGGVTALSMARKHGDIAVVRALLDLGAR